MRYGLRSRVPRWEEQKDSWDEEVEELRGHGYAGAIGEAGLGSLVHGGCGVPGQLAAGSSVLLIILIIRFRGAGGSE